MAETEAKPRGACPNTFLPSTNQTKLWGAGAALLATTILFAALFGWGYVAQGAPWAQDPRYYDLTIEYSVDADFEIHFVSGSTDLYDDSAYVLSVAMYTWEASYALYQQVNADHVAGKFETEAEMYAYYADDGESTDLLGIQRFDFLNLHAWCDMRVSMDSSERLSYALNNQSEQATYGNNTVVAFAGFYLEIFANATWDDAVYVGFDTDDAETDGWLYYFVEALAFSKMDGTVPITFVSATYDIAEGAFVEVEVQVDGTTYVLEDDEFFAFT